MPAIFYLKIYLITFLTFLGIDAVWLTKIAPKFYKNNIGHLMADKPNLVPAGIFYFLNIFGILIFAILPALKNTSPKIALVYGALYGFFTYATYDLTNFATLSNWPAKVVYVDILWGVVLTATVSVISYYIGTKIS